jgi:hypothetical protein
MMRGRPAQLVIYAERRGGNVTVDINDEDYVFIFRLEKEGEGWEQGDGRP